jgi:PLP dependent protein
VLIRENINDINNRIKLAAINAGRDPKEIHLLAVTKTHPTHTIEEALDSGIKFIGENRIQEAEEKIPVLSGKFKEFHFIGHLQSNKIKKLMKLKPSLIHSIDNLKTAKKLNDYLTLCNLQQDILIQVNTSAEASKFGIEPGDTIEFIKQFSRLPRLKIKGLMTIGKFTDNETEIRACFKTLHNLFEQIKREGIPNVEMSILSMGMTSDFEIAIEEGANLVRIGSAIFGTRNH